MIFIFWIFCLVPVFSHVNYSRDTPLNGRQLRVLPMDLMYYVKTTRNETGHILEITGIQPLMLQWLAKTFNFTYTYLNDFAPLSEDSPKRRGAISYIISREADLLLGVNVPSPRRFKNVDYPASWVEGPLTILIPSPKSSVTTDGVFRPFTQTVWISILITVPLTFISLHVLSTLGRKFLKNSPARNSHVKPFSLSEGVLYIIGCLLGQGTLCVNNTLVVRSITAAWALVCFVLVQCYNTTLISFLTSPVWKPIIESLYDIPNVPGLKITVDKGYAADFTFMNTNQAGIHKYLADMLKNNPQLRCDRQQECLDKVRSGRYVYIHGKPLVYEVISRDLETTGKCNFATVRGDFQFSPLFLSLPKGSSYTEHFSRGILRLRESGLLLHWTKLFSKQPTKCLSNNHRKTNSRQSLGFNNLSMAFMILGSGYLLSFILFILEKIHYRCSKMCKIAVSNSKTETHN